MVIPHPKVELSRNVKLENGSINEPEKIKLDGSASVFSSVRIPTPVFPFGSSLGVIAPMPGLVAYILIRGGIFSKKMALSKTTSS